MLQQRIPLYRELEEKRNSKIITFITGDRRNLETQIANDILEPLTYHLDITGDVDKISLFLYTRGGDTLASWSIVNLIKQFCKTFEVIIPQKSLSSGTLISLGADNILMTKQATLGPIDPSVNHSLNPSVETQPGTKIPIPVSVEDLNGYLEFVKNSGVSDEDLRDILVDLAQQIHPLVLGKAYRARSQIRMLAKKLLKNHSEDEDQQSRILEFLCSESGSHDYTINRNEAKDELGLNIEKPDDNLYEIIKRIYDDISQELELPVPFDLNVMLGQNNNVNYNLRRGLLESIKGGCHVFISEGVLQRVQTERGLGIQDNRIYEGWKHEPNEIE